MGDTPGKKPRAASARKRAGTRPQSADREIYTAMERLGADKDPLAIVDSWRDTLADAEVLSMLREHNATGRTLHRQQ